MTNSPSERSQPNTPDSEPSLKMLDVMSLPDEQRSVVNWLIRKSEATLAEIVEQTGQSEPVVQTMLNDLVQQGFVQPIEVEGKQCYRPILGSKPKSRLSKNIWDALG
jgi:predicted transcriptional regulator